MTSAGRRGLSAPDRLRVEVAYAEPARQFLRALELPPGATVADAIAASDVAREYAIDTHTLVVSIWSKVVDRLALLQDGDRVELLRPLKIDPKDARRKRAKLKSA